MSRRAGRLCAALLTAAVGCGGIAGPAEPREKIEAHDALDGGRAAMERRQWDGAARAFGRAAVALSAAGEPEAAAAAWRDQAEALRSGGKPQDAGEAGRRALAIDQHLGLQEAQAKDLACLARAAAAAGDPGLAIDQVREARTLTGPVSALAVVLDNDLALYLLRRNGDGDRFEAERLLFAAREINQARGDEASAATNQLLLGRAALQAGEPQHARALVEPILDVFRRTPDPRGLAFAHELLSEAARQEGDAEAAHYHRTQARAAFTFLNEVSAPSGDENDPGVAAPEGPQPAGATMAGVSGSGVRACPARPLAGDGGRLALEPVLGEWEPLGGERHRLVLTLEGGRLHWGRVYEDGSGEVWLQTVFFAEEPDGTLRTSTLVGGAEHTLRLDGATLVVNGADRYRRAP